MNYAYGRNKNEGRKLVTHTQNTCNKIKQFKLNEKFLFHYF